jgi:ribosomal protein S18 acetylase RimI-like enzyme
MKSVATDPQNPRTAFVRAQAHDLAELRALVEEYYAFDGIAIDAASVRRGLASLMHDPTLGGAWLVRQEGHAVGYFVLTYGFDLEFGGRQATVTELFLRPEGRRLGLGSEALRFIEDHLRTAGIGAYELQVERGNAAARAFYAAAGFESHDRIPLSKKVPPRPPVDGHAVARARSEAVTVRPATDADLATVVALALELGRQHEGYDARRFRLGAFGETDTELRRTYERFFADEFGSPEAVLLVAEAADLGVVGYAYGKVEASSFVALCDVGGWIHDLFVDPRACGQGLGERLVQAAIVALRARGAPQILLSVSPKNRYGQALFDRLGFTTTMLECLLRDP